MTAPTLDAVLAAHPTHRALLSILSTLLPAAAPPFLYIHDPHTPRLAGCAVRELLASLSASDDAFRATTLDGVACFTPKLLFTRTLDALARHVPVWPDCRSWTGPGGERYDESLDSFLHGLRALESQVRADNPGADVRMVLFVDHAERVLPELLVPLARLAELARVDVTTVFLSAARWADVRPPLGAAPEPFHLSVDAPAKPDTLAYLAARYPTTPPSPTTLTPAHTYAASLAPLHGAFCAALHATLAPFTPAPDALAAVAAARWPGFVLPLLDAHAASLAAAAGDEYVDGDEEGATGEEAVEPAPPAEDTRMRLLRLFTPSFAAALDALAAGASDAAGWAAADAAAADTHAVGSALAPSTTGADALRALPRLQRFVLLAAYLASTNPAKVDARVLGRLADGRARGRRRGGGGTGARRGRGGRGGANKVSQRLLGPTPFPLDRLLAVLGVLLEEHDADARAAGPRGPGGRHSRPGEDTELELQRVGVYAAVAELAGARLLVRASPPERLDGPPTFRAAIAHADALVLAKDFKIALHELLWEAA